MRVQVLFFGMLKDITGLQKEDVELSSGSRMESVFDHFASRYPRLREFSSSIVLARNQQFVSRDAEVTEGDEIAFLPPVSGGSGRYSREIREAEGHLFALTREPIDTGGIRAHLLEGHDGAVVTFEGVVRNHTRGRGTLYLDYECYEAMAIQVIARLGREIAAAHPISRIAMVHRLGRLETGEASVVVMVTSPHRNAAFEAALEGINRLKKTVPVWKKEHFEDGEVWVEGEWDATLLPH